MPRIAILIDGSNFLAQLDGCDLGYPALSPLITRLLRGGDLSFARFYGAPPVHSEYDRRWQAFRAANRHVEGLDWFLGFRNADGKEKAVDVALAVDLVYGCKTDHFDVAVVIGGDGDHAYAFKVARECRRGLFVYLMPGQPSSLLAELKVPFRHFSVDDLLAWGVCERGKQSGVPMAAKAPPGHPDITLRLSGAAAKLVKP
jgi:uncharacterized LabA/DUF88 family protein